jgi:hypothetical protein
MTYQDIITRLENWREVRRISIDDQIKGLYTNLVEEIDEFTRAKVLGNKNEMIDALCDISIFCYNTLTPEYAYGLKRIILAKYGNFPLWILDSIVEATDFIGEALKFNVDLAKSVIPFILYRCARLINDLGYDYLECMDETLKEIESRTGYWDEVRGKFIKDNRGSYTADYSRCKFK